MKKSILWIFALTMVSSISGCGGDDYKKNPLDEIIRDTPTQQPFTVILHDMDVTGSFFHDYFHQYKIIDQKDSIPTERITEWLQVPKSYFVQHQDHMGMEIVHRGEDGKLEKEVAPPGYSNYVGNQRYGRWVNRNGSSFWEFYGQYMFMSTMFNMMAYPVRRSYYNDYRSNYYGTGRYYYGPRTGGRSYYGTGSSYTSGTRPNSSWSRNTSTFKNRVSSRTSRSSSRLGGSSRSSSGGFGK